MQSSTGKSFEKIIAELNKLHKLSKLTIKYGAILFFLLFAIGTLVFVISHSVMHYDSYLDFIAKSIVKSSFTVFAEIIIGVLLVDYIYKKT